MKKWFLYASTVQVTHRQLPSRTFVGNKGGQLSSLTVDLFYLDTFSETREQNYKRSHGCVSHVLQCPIPDIVFAAPWSDTPRNKSIRPMGHFSTTDRGRASQTRVVEGRLLVLISYSIMQHLVLGVFLNFHACDFRACFVAYFS